MGKATTSKFKASKVRLARARGIRLWVGEGKEQGLNDPVGRGGTKGFGVGEQA